MMKRCVLCILFVLLMVPCVQAAARAQVKTLAQDPYASALLVEADSGKVLFEANADAKLYPASVLKLMDLYVILQRIEQGALRLDEMVQVTTEAAKTGGSQVYLDPKEQFSVDDLLYALMVQSANDAAVALATHIAGSKEGFVALMNQKAQELGMNNTKFHSVHGLPPSEGQEPDVTTARDLVVLCRALAKMPEALKYTGTQNKGFREDKFMMYNHNKLLGQVVGCDGFKTGYYQAAGFSIAATALRGGVRMIAVVMGSKDRKVRDAKASELLNKGFTIIPPKPELAGAATLPKPAAGSQPQPAAGTVTFATPAAGDPAAPATQETPAEPTPKDGGDSGWGKFFIGLGIGFILFLALFGAAVAMMKRRTGSVRSRYRHRD
ncbi:MAG: serine hydrolase [Desulfobulbus sp.]|jgi:D-alanyl-D-alanine carboxypeptidase (penicillin-binding protein 5/6)|uniref:D-alanyl-D-alanine carboxypeptidase family protein n=1 Tax=Desulfobulbus sp. TaxID=895 RepID=UPI00284BDB12|nr:D-alanyl-D-alanine carboxypeptidase family protein [Desulfobulbus sp.]MDR2549083.1 serine hydrolase [Desulfobulbus sp.]